MPEPTHTPVSPRTEERGIPADVIESRRANGVGSLLAAGAALVLSVSWDAIERAMSTRQNKTALVTGASRAIGRATAAALAKAGAHVQVHSGRSAQETESLVSEIQTKGARANAISANLGTPNDAAPDDPRRRRLDTLSGRGALSA
jgi:hypothetical protein